MTETKPPLQPSSGTAGFFQEQPALCSIFDEDEAYQRVFKFYLPSSIRISIAPDLRHMSNLVISPQLLTWNADAERNTPYLRTWNSWGTRIDDLVTSEGWRELQSLGIREGIVALGHEGTHGRYDRVHQFLKYHIWTAMSADVSCPSAMTDGAARLLKLQMEKGGLSGEEGRVFERAWERLVSRDPGTAWTSGQWMTERSGGSDVKGTETVATFDPAGAGATGATDVDGNPLGPYSITGFKWFSSATDANSTVLLAKESPSGAISAFFAPTRILSPSNSDPVLNGISIQRLKPKLGTRALPTAELILTNLRAHRIGATGHGTKEISTILNITRVHNAVSAVSSWGRGLAISRAFSRIRRARGVLLMDLPAHVHTLAAQHVEYTAMMHLTFYTVALLGCSEHPQSSQSATSTSSLFAETSTPHLLRLLTPITKAITAKAAIAGLQECMESLGGVGYLENEDVSMNIARLYRSANVLSIWEGTTNVLADDLIRVVKGSAGPAALGALDGVVAAVLDHWRSSRRGEWADSVSSTWKGVRQRIERSSRDDLALDGRAVVKDLSWIVCAVLLGEDALSDGSPTANEICSRWISQRSPSKELSARSTAEAARWDRQIVFGNSEVAGASKL